MIWGILFLASLFLFVLGRFIIKPYNPSRTQKAITPTIQKIYWAILVAIVSAYSFFAFKAHLATNPSIANDQAEEAARTYLYWGKYLDTVAYIGLIPVALALWLCWAHAPRGKQFILIALLFFWLFIALNFLYLAERYFHFKKSHDIWAGEFSLSGLVGIIWAAVVSTITLFVYSVVVAQSSKK